MIVVPVGGAYQKISYQAHSESSVKLTKVHTCMWICMEIPVDIDLLREDLTKLLRDLIPIDSVSCQKFLIVDFRAFNKLHNQGSFCRRDNPDRSPY